MPSEFTNKTAVLRKADHKNNSTVKLRTGPLTRVQTRTYSRQVFHFLCTWQILVHNNTMSKDTMACRPQNFREYQSHGHSMVLVLTDHQPSMVTGTLQYSWHGTDYSSAHTAASVPLHACGTHRTVAASSVSGHHVSACSWSLAEVRSYRHPSAASLPHAVALLCTQFLWGRCPGRQQMLPQRHSNRTSVFPASAA